MNKDKGNFFIQTFGCQMNERDSETLAGILESEGYCETGERCEADVVIINTCSVRENADKRFFGTLGQMKKKKTEDPGFIVCVCGCMMQQQHIVDEVKTKYPWVDIIFGTHNIHNFPELLSAVESCNEKQVDVWTEGGDIVEHLPTKRKYKHKAFVNIMYGCNNFCTYCIVPFTRGRERSRAPEGILDEINTLVSDGVKEVTLLGQNVNSYKSDGVGFPQLIHSINEVKGLERIRFMTSHPKDLSQGLIDAFGQCEKLCGHIHLPVQSGSNEVLKRMNRRYTVEDYKKLISNLRDVRADMAITTDIIVGFPGETEKNFTDTLKLCEQVGFDSAFTFLYSIRKGTPAENYEDQVPEDVKHERFRRLVDVINGSSAEKNAARTGKVEKVLVEGESKKQSGVLTGRTEDFKTVDFIGAAALVGAIVPVKITEGKTFSLTGEITDKKYL